MKTKLLTLMLILLALPAFAEQRPRPLGSDSRIKHVIYNPNEIYEIKSTFGYQTTIEFSESESIQVASIGDSIAWQVVPMGNRVFLKPVEPNPRTNLTVITNKRTYYFNLSTIDARVVSDMTYLVRFEYSNAAFTSNGAFKPKLPDAYNFNYKLKDDKKSGLVRAFDDGDFTYLQFKSTSDLPAIFWIDSSGKESIVNYRIQGPYVVVERVVDKLLLRRGGIVGTVIRKKAKNNSGYLSSN
ncbi:MAG TPA: P-type conjugative transfer protein VirB9 [Deltaproteobacteria bacterium]|nr:MAG: P-type conjugative transfer protein VirB9 [Deltaproteobacteria bacterium GWA2_45_12]HBF12367.1 P-type conjugative transfer protein VirB9 [Deltaproteobacteria bacterium]